MEPLSKKPGDGAANASAAAVGGAVLAAAVAVGAGDVEARARRVAALRLALRLLPEAAEALEGRAAVVGVAAAVGAAEERLEGGALLLAVGRLRAVLAVAVAAAPRLLVELEDGLVGAQGATGRRGRPREIGRAHV